MPPEVSVLVRQMGMKKKTNNNNKWFLILKSHEKRYLGMPLYVSVENTLMSLGLKA